MSTGMLGVLSLSDIQGPMDELQSRLAGKDGQIWLNNLKRFLRKENTGSGCRVRAMILINNDVGDAYEKVVNLPIPPFLGMTFNDGEWGDPLTISSVDCTPSEDPPLTIAFSDVCEEEEVPLLLDAGWTSEKDRLEN